MRKVAEGFTSPVMSTEVLDALMSNITLFPSVYANGWVWS